MKYSTYIYRNFSRHPFRVLSIVTSTAVAFFVATVLVSFITINGEVASSLRDHHRIVVMSAQGFTGIVPITLVQGLRAREGVIAVTPYRWYGGKYHGESMPFAQFGVDAESYFKVNEEWTIPPDQLRAFQGDKAGCVIGRRLADERGLRIGDRLPLEGDLLPFDLSLTIRGIYDGPSHRDLRLCLFRWDYLDDGLRRDHRGRGAGNAGVVVARCRDAHLVPATCRAIDAEYLSSETPTRSQSEEEFIRGFGEMMRDFRWLLAAIGAAVITALVLASGGALAMAQRERMTDIAILRAIGYRNALILSIILGEAALLSGLGGLLGSIGSKMMCDAIDLARYSAGALPFFHVSWPLALGGFGLSLAMGLISGIIPALSAVQRPVVDGLRRVI